MGNNLKNKLKQIRNTGFFHIFCSSILNKSITLLSGIILIRILSKSEYGIYSYANNILGFFLIFSGLGANSAILQKCCEANNEQERISIYNFGFKFGFLFNFILAFLILLVSIFLKFPIENANYCLMIMCFIPLLQICCEMKQTYLRTEYKNKEYSYSNSFFAIVTFILACLLSYLIKIEGLILSHYIAYFLTILFVTFIYKVPVSKEKSLINNETKKDFLNISFISMINVGISQIMYLLDIFVLGFFVPDESIIASYKVATIIPTALSFIPMSIVIYIYPYFVSHRNDKTWLIQKFKLLLMSLGLFNLLISTIMFIFAPFIIKLVFGAQYLDSVVPFRILSCSYFVSGTFRIIVGNLLVTQKKLKFNLIESIITSGLNTVLNLILIPKMFSNGAAIATLITMIVSSVLSTLYFIHILKKEKNDIKN